jgi:two-component sensor histidine kinase/PAS domain-containing protein
MPSMSEVIAEHSALSAADVHWLSVLVEEWQLLADLAFSDRVPWVPVPDGNVFWAAAQVRPTTGPTALVDDVVGDLIAYSPEHLVSQAFITGRVTSTSQGKLQAGIPVDVHAIPVGFGDRIIAVVEQHTNQLAIRTAGALERTYLGSSAELAEMVRAGEFPSGDGGEMTGLRVGDGFIRIDADGDVTFASPNALSAYRRLGLTGDLVDANLTELTSDLVPAPDQPIHDSLSSALNGKGARELEVVSGTAQVMMRIVPLTPAGVRTGAIVLCRDVTDLRRKERELLSKEATIREIHHRVKNNLQTVAALLRMQARRIEAPEAKQALNDAMSRVASIAIVHETLSQAFDEMVEFDKVADLILKMVGDVAAADGTVRAQRQGSFGVVSSSVAANLSLVLTEICQNAIEHGLANGSGDVLVKPQVNAGRLRMEVIDPGSGLPKGFAIDDHKGKSLGLSIVTGLVGELGGTFDLTNRTDAPGTRAVVEIPVSPAEG